MLTLVSQHFLPDYLQTVQHVYCFLLQILQISSPSTALMMQGGLHLLTTIYLPCHVCLIQTSKPITAKFQFKDQPADKKTQRNELTSPLSSQPPPNLPFLFFSFLLLPQMIKSYKPDMKQQFRFSSHWAFFSNKEQ